MELQEFADSQVAAIRADIAMRAAEHTRPFEIEEPGFMKKAIQQSEETTQRLQSLRSV